ncbi:hypothetical protein ACFL3I_07405 [Pseudomonadota bacterium]
MSIQEWAAFAEIIGAVAVVASLIYLAVQIRQNTEAQRTENYARALERLAAFQSMLSTDSEISIIFSKGLADYSNLATQEKLRFNWVMYEAFGAFEFMFHAARKESIDEEIWSRWSDAIAWYLTFPGVHAWWMSRPLPFTDSYSLFVDSLLKDNPTDVEKTQRWLEFISHENSQG